MYLTCISPTRHQYDSVTPVACLVAAIVIAKFVFIVVVAGFFFFNVILILFFSVSAFAHCLTSTYPFVAFRLFLERSLLSLVAAVLHRCTELP